MEVVSVADSDVQEYFQSCICKYCETFRVPHPAIIKNVVGHAAEDTALFDQNCGVIINDSIHICLGYGTLNKKFLEYAAIICLLPNEIQLNQSLIDVVYILFFLETLECQPWIDRLFQRILTAIGFGVIPGRTKSETLSYLKMVDINTFVVEFLFQLPEQFHGILGALLVNFFTIQALKRITIWDIKNIRAPRPAVHTTPLIKSVSCNYGVFGLHIVHTFLRFNTLKSHNMRLLFTVLKEMLPIRSLDFYNNIVHLNIAIPQSRIAEWGGMLKNLHAKHVVIDYFTSPLKRADYYFNYHSKISNDKRIDTLIPFSDHTLYNLVRVNRAVDNRQSVTSTVITANFIGETPRDPLVSTVLDSTVFSPILALGYFYHSEPFSLNNFDMPTNQLLADLMQNKAPAEGALLTAPDRIKKHIKQKTTQLKTYLKRFPSENHFLQNEMALVLNQPFLLPTDCSSQTLALLPENINIYWFLPTPLDPKLMRNFTKYAQFMGLNHASNYVILTKIIWIDFLVDILLKFQPTAFFTECEQTYWVKKVSLGLYYQDNHWVDDLWDFARWETALTEKIVKEQILPEIPLVNRPKFTFVESDFVAKLALTNKFFQLHDLFEGAQISFITDGISSISTAFQTHLAHKLNRLKAGAKNDRFYDEIINDVFVSIPLDPTMYTKGFVILKNARFSVNPYGLMENHPFTGLFNPYLYRIWHTGGDTGITVLEYLVPHTVLHKKTSQFMKYFRILEETYRITLRFVKVERETRFWNALTLTSGFLDKASLQNERPPPWSFEAYSQKRHITYGESFTSDLIEAFYLNNKIWRLLGCSFIIMVDLKLPPHEPIPEDLYYYFTKFPGGFIYEYHGGALCFLYAKYYAMILFTRLIGKLLDLGLEFDAYNLFDLSSHLGSPFERVVRRQYTVKNLEGGVNEWPVFAGKSMNAVYSHREYEILKDTLVEAHLTTCTTRQWNYLLRACHRLMEANAFSKQTLVDAIQQIT